MRVDMKQFADAHATVVDPERTLGSLRSSRSAMVASRPAARRALKVLEFYDLHFVIESGSFELNWLRRI